MACGGDPFRRVSFLRREPDAVRRTRRSFAPKPAGGRRHAKLVPHRTFLLKHVAEKGDINISELVAELAAATDVKVDLASLSLIRAG